MGDIIWWKHKAHANRPNSEREIKENIRQEIEVFPRHHFRHLSGNTLFLICEACIKSESRHFWTLVWIKLGHTAGRKLGANNRLLLV